MLMTFEDFTTNIKETRVAAEKMKEYFLEIMVEFSDKIFSLLLTFKFSRSAGRVPVIS